MALTQAFVVRTVVETGRESPATPEERNLCHLTSRDEIGSILDAPHSEAIARADLAVAEGAVVESKRPRPALAGT